MSITILADRDLTRPQAVKLARRMYGNGDAWTYSEIARYITACGVRVTRQTVRLWVDPEYAEQRNASLRASKRRYDRTRRGTRAFRVFDEDALQRLGFGPAGPPSKLTPELLLALRVEDGLSYNAIAVVARRFFGEEMTPEQARYRLYELGAPKNPNRTRRAA